MHYAMNHDKANKADIDEAGLREILMGQLKHKQSERMPHVIVPDEPYDLDITDKEGNCVYRFICYKAQVEDVLKALRRKGLSSRTFTYDKIQWEEETKKRGILKEQVQNLTTTLMMTAISSFQ